LHGDGAFAWKTCTFLHHEKYGCDARRTIDASARQQRQLQTLPSLPARRAVVNAPHAAEPAID
jgi:hypothetical protein